MYLINEFQQQVNYQPLIHISTLKTPSILSQSIYDFPVIVWLLHFIQPVAL